MIARNPVLCMAAWNVSNSAFYIGATNTYEWLVAGMGADVDLEVCLLVEALVAIGDGALVALPWLLGSLCYVVLSKLARLNEACRRKTTNLLLRFLRRATLFRLNRPHQSVDIGGEVRTASLSRLRV
jgi:hypothetical protein